MQDLEKALLDGIAELEPVPAGAVERIIEGMRDMIALGYEEKDDAKWKALARAALAGAKRFEIHCWSDEEEWAELALRYGKMKESKWRHGMVVEGEVTEAFRDMLLGEPKPKDTGTYNKMTPFFNVFLDNGFSSSHYGTEVFVQEVFVQKEETE